jgi:hypothetical protein
MVFVWHNISQLLNKNIFIFNRVRVKDLTNIEFDLVDKPKSSVELGYGRHVETDLKRLTRLKRTVARPATEILADWISACYNHTPRPTESIGPLLRLNLTKGQSLKLN